MKFSEWLRNEMQDRGIGVRELARMASVSAPAISNVLNEQRRAGAELCHALAKALKLPEEEVLERAGILCHPSINIRLFGQLNPDQREVILKQMRAMVAENRAHYHTENVPET